MSWMSFSRHSQHNMLGQGTLPIILITALEGLILACQCSFLDTCWLVHCMKWINLSYKKEANKKTYHRNGNSPDAPLVTLAVTQCHIRSHLVIVTQVDRLAFCICGFTWGRYLWRATTSSKKSQMLEWSDKWIRTQLTSSGCKTDAVIV